MTRNGILAAGNFIVDKVKVIDTFPAQDTLANILSEQRCNGGSALNVLIDLARMKAPFPLHALGVVGEDELGQWIRSLCIQNGIDESGLQVVGQAPTSYTDVMSVKATGRRTFFHQRGANALLDQEHFDFGRASAKILHLGYLLLLDRLDHRTSKGTVAAEVLKAAKEAGLKTSVDVVSEDSSRFRETVLPSLAHTDYCFMNEIEVERTTGVNCCPEGVVDWGAVGKAAGMLLTAGVREWAIIHCAEGCLAASPTGECVNLESVPMPAEQIQGCVGAGDAFAAGVLYGLHEDMEIGECLRYGTCVAAACLTDVTTSGGVRPLTECLALCGASEAGHEREVRGGAQRPRAN